MDLWKMIFLYNPVLFRSHANLPECICLGGGEVFCLPIKRESIYDKHLIDLLTCLRECCLDLEDSVRHRPRTCDAHWGLLTASSAGRLDPKDKREMERKGAPSSVLVTTSKALVARSHALVPSSFLFQMREHMDRGASDTRWPWG